MFPAYLYDAYELVLAVTPKDVPEDTKDITYLYLPSAREQMDRALERGGISSYEEAQVRVDYDARPNRVREALMVSNESLEELNEMCRAIHGLTEAERTKLDVVVDCASPSSALQIARLAEKLWQRRIIGRIRYRAREGSVAANSYPCSVCAGNTESSCQTRPVS